ncbi:MAG: hypothetical protein ACFHXK_03130 [bacterium]
MNDKDLDDALAALAAQRPPTPDYLAARIIANLPEPGAFELIRSWLLHSVWRGATALILPLVIGFVLGSGTGVSHNESWTETESLLFVDALLEYDSNEI